MTMFSNDALFTIVVVLLTMGALVLPRFAPDLVLMGALTLLLMAGVLTPAQMLEGLSNPGLATVGVLFVVTAGLVGTGVTRQIGEWFLGRSRSIATSLLRLMVPVAVLSAFLNNTPVVAMMVPAVEDWARRQNVAVSKLMIPLSYAAILGGTCTIIGTSTNLIINSLAIESGIESLSFFEIALVGLPCALLGIAFTIISSKWLLPTRPTLVSAHLDPREYAVEMLVDPTSPIVGRTIEEAGLRQLPGAYLAEIERDGEVMPAVAPSVRLRENDRLVFVGIVESVVDLMKTKGLIPAAEQLFKLDAPRQKRCLIEAVVSDRCPIVGRTIREGRFRSNYEAVVLAVARHGERVAGKIGDISLRSGDTLLLEARPSFVQQHYDSRDFLLVSEVARSEPPSHDRAWISIGILAAMVAGVTLGGISMLKAALLAAGLMVLTRCATSERARRSIDWSLLTVIAAALGIGKAMQVSGAAEVIAQTWMSLAGEDPWAALTVVYITTALFTAFLTNIAAAVLMFPIALSAAAGIEVSPYPFMIAIMMAASTSFATPIGYQTNLMVYGPGGYRFVDYLRIGLPLNVVIGITAILLIPRLWPF
jgi:di/tricarboxylate transporter